jgi:hypothetical protein
MRIPLYLQLKNDKVACIAYVVIHGSDTIDQTFSLGKLPSPAKTILLNYNADILSDN